VQERLRDSLEGVCGGESKPADAALLELPAEEVEAPAPGSGGVDETRGTQRSEEAGAALGVDQLSAYAFTEGRDSRFLELGGRLDQGDPNASASRQASGGAHDAWVEAVAEEHHGSCSRDALEFRSEGGQVRPSDSGPVPGQEAEEADELTGAGDPEAVRAWATQPDSDPEIAGRGHRGHTGASQGGSQGRTRLAAAH